MYECFIKLLMQHVCTKRFTTNQYIYIYLYLLQQQFPWDVVLESRNQQRNVPGVK